MTHTYPSFPSGIIHNWTEVCNLLEFKLDCSPSTKISFIVDRIIDRHGGAFFFCFLAVGELHSESRTKIIDSLSWCKICLFAFHHICWVYCIIQSTSPLTVYLSIGSKLDAVDTFQLLQLRASDLLAFPGMDKFSDWTRYPHFPPISHFVVPKLMVEMIIFPWLNPHFPMVKPPFSHDFPMIFPSNTAIADQAAPLAISRCAWTASILRRSLAESRARWSENGGIYPEIPGVAAKNS